MEIKWYWPMEMLGFVENISAEYQDGYIHYSVSGSCDTVMMWLLLGLFPLLFLFGFLTRRLSARAGRGHSGDLACAGQCGPAARLCPAPVDRCGALYSILSQRRRFYFL